MDIFRKIGIAIAMIIPGFVVGGLVWQFGHSWLGVLAVEVVLIYLYYRIITGKFSAPVERAHHAHD